MEKKPITRQQGLMIALLITVFLFSIAASFIIHFKVKDRWYESLDESSYTWVSGELADLKIKTVKSHGVVVERNYQLYLAGQPEPFQTYNLMHAPGRGKNTIERLREGDSIEVKVLTDQYEHRGHWGRNPFSTLYFVQPRHPLIVGLRINGAEVSQSEYNGEMALWTFRDWRNAFVVLAPAIGVAILMIIFLGLRRKEE